MKRSTLLSFLFMFSVISTIQNVNAFDLNKLGETVNGKSLIETARPYLSNACEKFNSLNLQDKLPTWQTAGFFAGTAGLAYSLYKLASFDEQKLAQELLKKKSTVQSNVIFPDKNRQQGTKIRYLNSDKTHCDELAKIANFRNKIKNALIFFISGNLVWESIVNQPKEKSLLKALATLYTKYGYRLP